MRQHRLTHPLAHHRRCALRVLTLQLHQLLRAATKQDRIAVSVRTFLAETPQHLDTRARAMNCHVAVAN
jgi:hypothetical protein